MEEKNGVTRIIAAFASNLSYESIDLKIIEYTKTLIIDQLGVIFASYHTPAHRVCQKFLNISFGCGEAPVWGTEFKSTLPGAVLHNSMLGSVLDLDDGHRLALGHPGAAIIPAAITVAETRNKTGRALIESIIAGYEVALRISMARDVDKLDNLCTGVWGGFGAGIASGKLIFNGIEPIENIIGIVTMYSPALPGYIPHGRQMIKEGIPWSAMVGVQAALATEVGFKGPKSILDFVSGYDAEKLTYELGRLFLIKDTYIKEYACCRWLHTIIQLCHALMQENRINVNEIKKVRVKTFSRALRLPNKVAPVTIEDAQFSIPFCSALALTKGKSALHLIDPKNLRDPEIINVSQKVTLLLDDEVEAKFPEKVGAKVEIETREKSFSKSFIGPIKGDAGRAFSRKDVKVKYMRYAKRVIGGDRAENLFKYVENLDTVSNVSLSKLMT